MLLLEWMKRNGKSNADMGKLLAIKEEAARQLAYGHRKLPPPRLLAKIEEVTKDAVRVSDFVDHRQNVVAYLQENRSRS